MQRAPKGLIEFFHGYTLFRHRLPAARSAGNAGHLWPATDLLTRCQELESTGKKGDVSRQHHVTRYPQITGLVGAVHLASR